MKTLKNPLSPIFFGKEALQLSLPPLLKGYSSVVLVYDSTLIEWADFMENLCNEASCQVITIAVPPGEESKCRAMKAQIEDTMLDEGADRHSLLIALGGGVLTDLAGFVAATFMRGIPFLSIPTTLLGMVDAALGGKTGINTAHGKNLIGAFYLPKAIIIDPIFLPSLPLNIFRDGFAEVIKYGCILDAELFDKLHHSELFFTKDPSYIEWCIERSIASKLNVVASDPHESGFRRVLNFGHTIAHALELLSNYQLSHGNAVAMGLLGEGYLSMLEGHLPEKSWKRIEQTISSFQFPNFSLQTFDFDSFYTAMRQDKKNERHVPRFVQLNEIGHVVEFNGEYCSPVNEKNLKQVFSYLKDRL